MDKRSSIPSGYDEFVADGSATLMYEQKPSLWERIISSWYHLTAPAEPPGTASFDQWEAFRRGRLASITLLLLILVIITFMAAITVISNTNHTVLVVTGLALCILSISAGLLNRRGEIVLATILMLIEINGGIAATVLTVPGGLGLVNLPLFDLLIGSEIIAVSLLPPQSVFFVAIVNSLFIIADIMFQHHTPDLTHFMGMSGGPVVIIRPVVLQFAVALATYLWVKSALNALMRAGRAEAVAALEHTIAEQERAQAQQKYQLERSIQYLVETQRRVANGDFSARVPLTQDNVLWQVAGSFNNLLTRFQRLRQDSYEYQRVQTDIPRLVAAIREAKKRREPLRLTRSGTALDAVILELTSRE